MKQMLHNLLGTPNTNPALQAHAGNLALAASETGSQERIAIGPEDEARFDQIINDPLLQEVPEAQRAEVVAQTSELYAVAKEYVGPVITGFADYLLREADGKQIIFAGRDGIGA